MIPGPLHLFLTMPNFENAKSDALKVCTAYSLPFQLVNPHQVQPCQLCNDNHVFLLLCCGNTHRLALSWKQYLPMSAACLMMDIM